MNHPRGTLAVGIALAVVAGMLTAHRLEFKTRRQDLVNPRSEFHQRWLAYVDEFGNSSDVVVVVESKDPSTVRTGIHEVGRRLRERPDLFNDVLDEFRAPQILGKGLYFLPTRQLERIETFVAAALNQLANPHVSLDDLLNIQPPHSADPIALATLTDDTAPSFSVNVGGPDWIHEIAARFPRYILAQEGRMGIVMARLATSPESFVPDAEPFAVLEQLQSQLEESHPGVRIGVTGIPILEYAEMQTSQQDMAWASLVTVVGVSLLVWAGFGGWKYPLLGMASLLIGIAWTWGYLTLTVGHLNILSMSFGVILIGLGIDFAVHFMARYLHVRDDVPSTDEALDLSMRQVGPPILAGGLTTAAAFLATSVTEFKGVAELGIIAGGGILLCVASTLFILPSGIHCVDARSDVRSKARLLAMESLVVPFWRRPWRTLMTVAGCSAFLATGLTRLQYDHNLLHLQAQELPSVVWEKKLLQQTDRNTWFAVSIADSLEQVRTKKEEFEKLSSVHRVDEIASLLPAVSPKTQRIVRRIHQQLVPLPSTEPVLEPTASPGMPLERQSPSPARSRPSAPTPHVESDSQQVSLNAKRALAASALWRSLRQIQAMSSPMPPQLDDIPAPARNRFVGRSGKHLLRVFPRDDIWLSEPLKQFVRELETVDPRVTGDPIETFYASHQMKKSYVSAAWLAAIVVMAVLVLDLRCFSDALLALLPTCLGLIQLFGLMGLLGIPLNPANVIVLPLIIGIGIDDGIHVIHDHRQRPEPGRLSRATVAGILLTSMTSMIGFGSLMLAQHEGLRSLGRVVTLGIACCLLTSVILLPCLLGMLHRRESAPLRLESRSFPPH